MFPLTRYQYPRAAEDLAQDTVSFVGSGAAWQFGNPCSVLTPAHSADLYPVRRVGGVGGEIDRNSVGVGGWVARKRGK